MDKPAYTISGILVVLAIVLLFVLPQNVSANDITVDKHCSLAQAIGSANNNSSKARCVTGFRVDTIFLEEDLELEDELPEITSRIVLEGNDHTIRIRPRRAAFVINWGNLTIKNLTVKFVGVNRAGPTIEIENGSLTIVDSQFLKCTGKFKVEDSLGVVKGESSVCGYSAETVASWFEGAPSEPTPTPEPSQPRTCDALADGRTHDISHLWGRERRTVSTFRQPLVSEINPSLTPVTFDAVDVWGYVEQGVEICFPQLGSVIFLDAAMSPRARAPVEYFARDGGTCAQLDRPGTVVLVPGQPPVIESVVPEQAPLSDISLPEQTCGRRYCCGRQHSQDSVQITTIANLKLRSIPFVDDNIIGYVPRGETFIPISGNAYWHNVSYQGMVGWISGNPRYVQASEACA